MKNNKREKWLDLITQNITLLQVIIHSVPVYHPSLQDGCGDHSSGMYEERKHQCHCVAQVEHNHLHLYTLSPMASLTSSVLVAQVGKSPDVGQVHGKSYHRQEEVDLLPPGLPVFLLTGVFLGGGCSHQGRGGKLNTVLLLHQDQLHLESHSVQVKMATFKQTAG